jgi:hypothetical protein
VDGDQTKSRHRVRIVHSNVPGWLALLLVLPAAVLFAVSLAIVVAVGLIGALFLPIIWQRLERVPKGNGDCIELDPGDFHTVEKRDRLPPP